MQENNANCAVAAASLRHSDFLPLLLAAPRARAFADHNAERVREARSFLFGATTYRGAVTYWPHQFEVPDMPESHYYIAQRYADGIPITVVSDSLTEQDTGPWREQTTIVRRSDAHEAVARLREQDGDALIFGSRTLWTDLLAHGFVDELHLMIRPKIVAGDNHAFAGVPETELRLLDVRRWDDSDNVLLRYATAHA